MFQSTLEFIMNPQTLAMIATMIGVAATLVTVGLPLLERNEMRNRLKATVTEREQMRQRERAKLAEKQNQGISRDNTGFVGDVVAKFNLVELFSDRSTGNRLKMAGLRGGTPLIVFAFARLVTPIVLFVASMFYLFVLDVMDQPPMIKLLVCLLVAFAGFYGPNIWLTNKIQKRQKSIMKAWPDALDLMLICVESGMSIEGAFQRVSQEVGVQSPELAEELALTTAELSYLQDRRQAYDNMGQRTGLQAVKAVATSLIQSEKYGTPVATALRVLAQEGRDIRMTEAEKKAAALPPKLTVPMILFFLPVLFAVILTPAILQIMGVEKP